MAVSGFWDKGAGGFLGVVVLIVGIIASGYSGQSGRYPDKSRPAVIGGSDYPISVVARRSSKAMGDD